MENKLIEKLKYLGLKDYIKSIFMVESDNKSAYFNYVYIIVDDPKIFQIENDLINLIEKSVLVNRSKDHFLVYGKKQNFTKIKIFSEEFNLLEVSIISDEFKEEFFKNLSNDINFIIDKENYSSFVIKNYKLFDLPKPYEYEFCIREFFSNILESSYAIKERDLMTANFKLQNAREELIKMANWYIIDKYNGTKSAGKDGDHLKYTVTKEIKDFILRSFSSGEVFDLYEGIFNCCSIFRNMGLYLDKHEELNYLKKEDVEIIKILRKQYKETDSILR
ncbi:MAG: aminoglycoside 6-adenylyltransferase [Peptoniphilaceae bacterium]|nr:aminoglycoside 6-adenylyltransferase [Peptoniphilaceae bacterium]MDD7383557.1 aminoglycoside 6-adenylyltransferase [Peptoniphilaceae bacterium]MDY3738730.1 aminoglycoside 6-adenylyltransferase [Peptoniphilaceae bacterium]